MVQSGQRTQFTNEQVGSASDGENDRVTLTVINVNRHDTDGVCMRVIDDRLAATSSGRSIRSDEGVDRFRRNSLELRG